jgi:Polysaccharide lyase
MGVVRGIGLVALLVCVLAFSAARPWSMTTTGALGGTIVWTADGSHSLAGEWASLATQDQCSVNTALGLASSRVAVVKDATSPSRSGRFYRIGIVDRDNCGGERAELAQGNPMKWSSRLFFAGQDRWISWAVRLGPSFPTTTWGWQVISQWKQTVGYPGGSYGGSPKFAMEVEGGHWYMDFTSYDPSDQWNPSKGAHRVAFGGRPVTGRWVRFTMHVVFSDDPNVGRFTLFGDMGDGLGWRTLVGLERTPTLLMDVPGTKLPVPSHMRIGIYRDASAYSANTSIDFAGVTVATSRQAAQGNAFGGQAGQAVRAAQGHRRHRPHGSPRRPIRRFAEVRAGQV